MNTPIFLWLYYITWTLSIESKETEHPSNCFWTECQSYCSSIGEQSCCPVGLLSESKDTRVCLLDGLNGKSYLCCEEETDERIVTPGPGKRLMLTPLIERGELRKARMKSRVRNLTDVISYSGYFTVNKTSNSNLFFWFFPAAYNPKTAPFLLWLQGGPGGSSLFAVFNEHGPIKIDSKYDLHFRDFPWTETNSVLYIDSPVGAGFSYTNDPSGYAKNGDDVSRDLYNALVQFFTVFSDFRERQFYVCGESYAGKYCPSLAYKIDQENRKSPQLRINLRGLLLGNPFIDPGSATDYGEYYYQIGVVDLKQKAHFDTANSKIKDFIQDKKFVDALMIFKNLILDPSKPTYFTNVTGYTFKYNYLIQNEPADYSDYINFLEKDYVRRALHAGDQTFFDYNYEIVGSYLAGDFFKSEKSKLEYLLNRNYKVLVYAGQVDFIVPKPAIDRLLGILKWKGAQEYKLAEKKLWKVNNELTGYYKTSRKNFVSVLIRNAGHYVAQDQTEWAFAMVNRFTREQPF